MFNCIQLNIIITHIRSSIIKIVHLKEINIRIGQKTKRLVAQWNYLVSFMRRTSVQIPLPYLLKRLNYET